LLFQHQNDVIVGDALIPFTIF